VALLGDGELALAKGVPKLDSLVTGATDDLTVVGGEGNGEDILGVPNEAAGGLSTSDLPKTKSSVPTSGEGEVSITGDDCSEC